MLRWTWRVRAPCRRRNIPFRIHAGAAVIERLHRLLLDVIKDEFDRQGGADQHRSGAAAEQHRRRASSPRES